MRLRLLTFLLIFSAGMALGQAPQGSLRVTVKTDSGPVSDASIKADGHSIKTGTDGIALLSTTPGQVEVTVSKEGFFPAKATVVIVAAQQAQVDFELQPRQSEEQEVTVYATRTDVRMEDSPLHVEVVRTLPRPLRVRNPTRREISARAGPK